MPSPNAAGPAPRRQNRIEQLPQALQAFAREERSETLWAFGRELGLLLLELSKSLADTRRRRAELAAALERLAAAEVAYRRAFDDQHNTAEAVEQRWRQLARAGDAARAALALDCLNGVGFARARPKPERSDA